MVKNDYTLLRAGHQPCTWEEMRNIAKGTDITQEKVAQVYNITVETYLLEWGPKIRRLLRTDSRKRHATESRMCKYYEVSMLGDWTGTMTPLLYKMRRMFPEMRGRPEDGEEMPETVEVDGETIAALDTHSATEIARLVLIHQRRILKQCKLFDESAEGIYNPRARVNQPAEDTTIDKPRAEKKKPLGTKSLMDNPLYIFNVTQYDTWRTRASMDKTQRNTFDRSACIVKFRDMISDADRSLKKGINNYDIDILDYTSLMNIVSTRMAPATGRLLMITCEDSDSRVCVSDDEGLHEAIKKLGDLQQSIQLEYTLFWEQF